MSFAFPAAFFLTVLSIPIIACYLLKARLRQIPVSTGMFWNPTLQTHPARSPSRRLRHLLSLLMQLVVLLLLILAIAEPTRSGPPIPARQIVLIMDHSASMQASDIAPSRLEAARDAAHRIVDGLQAHDQLAVIACGSHAEVRCGLTDQAATLHRAIDSVRPAPVSTRLEPAIRLSRSLLQDATHGQVVVLTDGCATGEEPASAAASEQAPAITWQLFGTAAANIGITQFQVRRSPTDGLGYDVLISVRNASPRTVSCRVELRLQDVPVDVIPVHLQPEEVRTLVLQKTSVEGGMLQASITSVRPAEPSTADHPLSTGDDTSITHADVPVTPDRTNNRLAADDQAWAVLPARTPVRVLLVSPGNPFLESVFEANPLVQFERTDEFPENWPRETLVVLHGRVPGVLPAGNLLVLNPSSACDAWQLSDSLQNPVITHVNTASPLMAHVRLDNVRIPKATRLLFQAPPITLAGTSPSEPLYAQVVRSEGKCLVLSVDLDQSDLAFRTTFPILITNAVDWFAGIRGELQESLPTGATTRLSPDALNRQPGRSLFLMSPAGRRSAIAGPAPGSERSSGIMETASSPPQSLSLTAGPLDETGIWQVIEAAPHASSRVLSRIAVNLASHSESDLRPTRQTGSLPEAAALRPVLRGRPLWMYLVMAVCLIVPAEWVLDQRRWIR
jgi:hypothetical protein